MRKIRTILLVTALLCIANQKQALTTDENSIACFNNNQTAQVVQMVANTKPIDLNLRAKSA